MLVGPSLATPVANGRGTGRRDTLMVEISSSSSSSQAEISLRMGGAIVTVGFFNTPRRGAPAKSMSPSQSSSGSAEALVFRDEAIREPPSRVTVPVMTGVVFPETKAVAVVTSPRDTLMVGTLSSSSSARNAAISSSSSMSSGPVDILSEVGRFGFELGWGSWDVRDWVDPDVPRLAPEFPPICCTREDPSGRSKSASDHSSAAEAGAAADTLSDMQGSRKIGTEPEKEGGGLRATDAESQAAA